MLVQLTLTEVTSHLYKLAHQLLILHTLNLFSVCSSHNPWPRDWPRPFGFCLAYWPQLTFNTNHAKVQVNTTELSHGTKTDRVCTALLAATALATNSRLYILTTPTPTHSSTFLPTTTTTNLHPLAMHTQSTRTNHLTQQGRALPTMQQFHQRLLGSILPTTTTTSQEKLLDRHYFLQRRSPERGIIDLQIPCITIQSFVLELSTARKFPIPTTTSCKNQRYKPAKLQLQHPSLTK